MIVDVLYEPVGAGGTSTVVDSMLDNRGVHTH
jgi:hypothetical protein